ncbi:hypothetical protein RHSIM_Rhsim08G0093300 [Rhododendron simsii]|uniref:GPN-loop GTPase 2 n=1 Tax=Rhododendron simsii TaxID=118357 RepID=A0A834GQ45_RHOSS|nr:hypothetical protein RHSIM_Rhsim08G0093300 [Rhododendron simsii]
MVFGQVVIGPPGSGKTTYCNGMSQFLQLIGRKVAVINLDPANDSLPYECAINIEDLIKLSDVMNEHSLGPNGGLVYCMDYLEKNIDWLESKLKPLLKDHYLLFDFPGQVELFFLHANAKNVIEKLIKKLNLRLTAVHLVDAHLCSDPGKYVSALILSLSTMLHLELPHINVLSKIDLIENYGKLAFNLEFYTDVEDLSYLQHDLDQDPRSAKYRKMTKELCEVIENYGLISFSAFYYKDCPSFANGSITHSFGQKVTYSSWFSQQQQYKRVKAEVILITHGQQGEGLLSPYVYFIMVAGYVFLCELP